MTWMNYCKSGWLVGIDLNAVILNDLKRNDYLGHMVVIFEADKANYWVHDPGLKPHPKSERKSSIIGRCLVLVRPKKSWLSGRQECLSGSICSSFVRCIKN